MRIKEITIENFRGFGKETFELDSRVNVILGDNTAGKTTLLQAIQIALGAFLQEMTFLPGGNGYSRNFRPSDHLKVFSNTTKSFIPVEKKPSIEVNAEYLDQSLVGGKSFENPTWSSIWWKRVSNKNSKANAGELSTYVANLESLRRNTNSEKDCSIFPIFLSFGATRLEKNYKGSEKTRQRESREAKAYKYALDEQVDFKGAFDWIYRYDKSLLRGNEIEGTDMAFINAVQMAIPALKQIIIDTKNSEFMASVQMAKDDSPYWLTYDMMSAGCKAMINIVAEIAHRCIELNGFLGIDTINKTPGIIMIDEVDLYLHPHWQQHVLEDLQRAFPMMQFIVSTHSPFIVQSVDSHNVITLDGHKSNSSPRMRSIEDIAVTEMNMDSARFPKYTLMIEKAEEYYQLVKLGKENTEEALRVKQELDLIEEQFSDDPAYVALLRSERKSL